ncbi:MAG: hypothetical protein FWF57_03230 [Defluviitaleaceae bacterium]|nr:hypothetical protein [Defluviitaleaceae bacterium]
MKNTDFLVLLLFVFFAVGCSGSNIPDVIDNIQNISFEDKINDMLKNLTSFEAIAEVTYISNKNINQYKINHIATINGYYFIEVIAPEEHSSNVTISNTIAIKQMNKNLNHIVNLDNNDTKERTSLLFTNFVSFFLENENSTIDVDEEFAILTVNTGSQNPYIQTLRLLIDSDLNPISLITYDINNNERILVHYLEFNYNPNIDMNIFEIN